MKPLSLRFLLCVIVSLPLTGIAQNGYGWGLYHGQYDGERNHCIGVFFQPPASRAFLPGSAVNVAQVAFPLVLGYGRTLLEMHQWGIDLGASSQSRFPTASGSAAAVYPKMRLSYRWLPLKGEYLVEPYLGGGIVGSVGITNMPNRRLMGASGGLQAMLGMRVHTGSPIFIHFEIPYTAIQLFDSGLGVETSFALDSFNDQFWPLIGIGAAW